MASRREFWPASTRLREAILVWVVIICSSDLPPRVIGNPQLGSDYALQQNGPAVSPPVLSRLPPTYYTASAVQPADQQQQLRPDYAIHFPKVEAIRSMPLAKLRSAPTSGALRFAFTMLKTHVIPQQINSALCPILPQTLLASLYDAADGEARAEMRAALQATSQELHPVLESQLLASNRSTVNKLDYAMAYFLAPDMKLAQDIYLQALGEGVSFQKVDFRNPNGAASVANRWVAEKTRGIIREIVAPASLDPATRLMMASVIYFKGKWKYQFTNTEPALFEYGPGSPPGSSSSSTLQVPMMYQFNKLRYGETESRTAGNGMRWVELPYEGSDGLSMVLMLPKVRHQLQRAAEELTLEDMSRLMEQLTTPRVTNKVHLYVPRFSVFSSSSLVPDLKRLGLRGIFERSTALAGLSNDQVVLRDVTQRTFISVDEQGTTATSVAALSFVALSAAPPPPTINFTVNEPFLVMIVDKNNQYPMFIAKVLVPEMV